MKRLLMTAAAAACLAGSSVAEDESPWSVSGTIGVASNYMFRGITQSNGDPALQAGVTVAHNGGFYAGFWGSSIDFGDGESELELDPFIGYGGALGENTTFDLNITYYGYPGTPSAWDYEFVEFIAGITHDFGPVSAGIKLAYSPDFFGGTGDAFWLGGNLTVPLGEYFAISGNIGQQWLDEDYGGADYLHYDIGISATYQNITFDARYVATDLNSIDEEFVFSIGFAF
ncbi:MAG: TorF family putative porin [Micropepsaceae bacterium]